MGDRPRAFDVAAVARSTPAEAITNATWGVVRSLAGPAGGPSGTRQAARDLATETGEGRRGY